jgi:hypothetical protein
MQYVNVLNGVVVGCINTNNEGVVSSVPEQPVIQFIVDDSTVVGVDYLVILDETGIPEFTPPTPKLPILLPVDFRNLFMIKEEISISYSTDPMVKTIWSRFTDPKVTVVDLNLPSVKDALEYLSKTKIIPTQTPDITYITPERATIILTGNPI